MQICSIRARVADRSMLLAQNLRKRITDPNVGLVGDRRAAVGKSVLPYLGLS